MRRLTITKREAVRYHREMWRWLAKHPEEKKWDWPGWKEAKKSLGIRRQIDGLCFLCEYDNNFALSCRACPLDWEMRSCDCGGRGYFAQWEITKGKERSSLALKIANLKERRIKK